MAAGGKLNQLPAGRHSFMDGVLPRCHLVSCVFQAAQEVEISVTKASVENDFREQTIKLTHFIYKFQVNIIQFSDCSIFSIDFLSFISQEKWSPLAVWQNY